MLRNIEKLVAACLKWRVGQRPLLRFSRRSADAGSVEADFTIHELCSSALWDLAQADHRL